MTHEPISLLRKRTPTFLNFPVIDRAIAEAMRTNRRPTELMMTPTDWRDDRMPQVAVVQIKWDGIHMGYRHGMAHAFTREGVDMDCADHLLSGLAALAGALRALFGTEHVLFGEYVHADGFEATLGDFRRGRGTGIVQVFDAVPVGAYEGREPSPALWDRLQRLQTAAKRLTGGVLGGVAIARSTIFEGEARENIVAMMPDLWAQGLEGIVVKDAAGPYVRAASPFWQRIKRRETVDLPIVRVDVVGGRLKALVLLFGKVEVRVGVGFSDVHRSRPSAFRPGMIVEVKHLGETGSGSLRSPSFLRIRPDKES